MSRSKTRRPSPAQIPLAERKSGIPEAVDTPAPKRRMTRRPSRSKAAAPCRLCCPRQTAARCAGGVRCHPPRRRRYRSECDPRWVVGSKFSRNRSGSKSWNSGCAKLAATHPRSSRASGSALVATKTWTACPGDFLPSSLRAASSTSISGVIPVKSEQHARPGAAPIIACSTATASPRAKGSASRAIGKSPSLSWARHAVGVVNTRAVEKRSLRQAK
mmetsp:Transcript_18307/g.44043  ORF Transcript_18307/g.44043 Transcript_18307/m.44043 type:complete len:217 (-) Transcript_18307:694-1344(-)